MIDHKYIICHQNKLRYELLGDINQVITTGCEEILCLVYSIDLVRLSAQTQHREELAAP